jgi:hypothetical protein
VSPASHAVHTVAACAENMPAGHIGHAMAPSTADALPGMHDRQNAVPWSGVNWPAGHGLHGPAPGAFL